MTRAPYRLMMKALLAAIPAGLILAGVATSAAFAQGIAEAEPGLAPESSSAGPTDSSAAGDTGVEAAGFWPFRRCRPCPPGWVPVAPGEAPAPPPLESIVPGVKPPEVAPKPGEVAPKPGELPPPEEAVPPSALARPLGVAMGPATAAPNMIGDFFGGGGRFFGRSTLAGVQNASVGIGGGDRRYKIIEANSPIPTDRFFFNYNHFENALLDIDEDLRNLDRFTFGVEKTFRDGLWSVELRAPFAAGYNSTQSLMAGASLSDTEFGDIALAVKRLLIQGERFKLAAGVGVVFPTGKDWKIVDNLGALVLVENEAVHLQPFLGALFEPNDRLFFLAFTQVDFDGHGNAVQQRIGGTNFDQLVPIGVYQEQSLLFMDFSAGYWLYKDPCAWWITGIAPVVEIHYSTTAQNTDIVVGPLGTIASEDLGFGEQQPPVGADRRGLPGGRRDVLNLTGGLHFQMGTNSTLTVAAVAPLRSGSDREFDAEFLVQLNRRF